MKERNPWLMVLIVVLVLAAASIACADDPDPPGPGDTLPAAIRGGGGFGQKDDKVTFGFQITCDRDAGVAQGQFQYVDRDPPSEQPDRVAFHGVVDMDVPGCEIPADAPGYHGTYVPQPSSLGDGGTLLIEPTDDACLKVSLSGGVYDGYAREGCQDFGNIRIWQWKGQ